MQRQMLKSKIHRATVTGCDLDYVGSITVDRDLLDQADILINEVVHVWDVTNGSRFVTYTIEGERGAGEIQVNGAAAHLVNEGDIVIIASFADYDERDLEAYAPVVVHVDAENRSRQVDSHPEILLAHGQSDADEIPGALSPLSGDGAPTAGGFLASDGYGSGTGSLGGGSLG